MENVDSFTQEYLERARQRREMLTKKLADTSPRRKSKRSIPLSESSDENIIVSAKEDDDSPNKRQCLREDELSLKPDTPAVPGVRSRMSRLLTDRSNWDNGSMDTDPTHTPSVEPVKVDVKAASVREKSPAPGARRNRLAALAQNINDWEDDTQHHLTKKDEKPKKVWQPTKEVEVPQVKAPSPRKQHTSGPEKPARVDEYSDKPKKYSPVKMISSPKKEYRREGDKVVSSMTFKLGSSSSLTPAQDKVKVPSPTKAPARDNLPKSPIKHASPAKPKVVAPPPVVLSTSNTAIKPGDAGKKKRRESFEPSAQPVSARLANWQHRVDTVESESMDPCNNAASRIRSAVGTTPKVSASAQVISRVEEEPTDVSVQSRMATWQHKTEQDDNSKPKGFVASAVRQTPVAPRSKSPQKAVTPGPSRSPVKSPTKVAPATKGIVDKLQKLQESWKDNGIADKIKQQRQADLQVLENRWKNGVLNEEQYTSQNTPKESIPEATNTPETIPIAPPLPVPVSGPSPKGFQATSTKPASPIKHVQAPQAVKTPRNESRHTVSKTPKEEARNKIRQDFEHKLKTLGFEVDDQQGHVATLDLKEQRERDRKKREAESSKPKTNVQVTENFVTTVKFDSGEKATKRLAPGTPVTTTVRPAATPSGGGSLYGLIKKQGNTPAQPSTPGVRHPQATPSGSAYKNKFQDSFSSDETSFEEDAGPQIEIKQSIQFRRPSQDSTASDMSESQTEGGTTQSDEYTDSEADETEYTMDETEADFSDDQGVDNLIDEAFSDTETDISVQPVPVPRIRREERPPSPQYVARKLPPEAHPGHPDHRLPTQTPQSTPSTSRTAPPKHPRLQEQHQTQEKHVGFISPGGSTYRSNSSGSEKSILREKPYSIDNYRSSANVKRNAPEPRMTIIRRSEHFDTDNTDPMPYVPEESVKHKIQELQELINQEQNVIMQTSNALNQCCGSDSAFAGSQESVECHRLLLQACKKREAYITEMQRLKTKQEPAVLGPKGSLTISDIRMPLKNDFVSKLGTIHDNTIHYLLVLFRHRAHVIFTQMVSTQDALIRGSLDIPNLIKLNDIRQDFVVDVEIYHMTITREMPTEKTPKKKKGMTPKKMMSASKRQQFQSPGGPLAVRTTNFTFIAGLPLTMRMVDKTHFNLERVPFSSPLQGTIHMRLRCLMEISVEEKGFLTMFEDVSSLGAWHRRWCVLKHNVLSFWKYPDDVKYKDPIGTIDLKCCISDEIGLVPRDVCARPNTLELITVRRQQRGELDTLVSRCYNTMTTTKHWISADTKDDRSVWAIKLNEALRNLRAWNPDALRPIKRQQNK